MEKNTRHAGVAVVDLDKIEWASPFLSRILAQRAELIILIEVLKLSKDKMVNIYTDSQYTFATAHGHRDY